MRAITQFLERCRGFEDEREPWSYGARRRIVTAPWTDQSHEPIFNMPTSCEDNICSEVSPAPPPIGPRIGRWNPPFVTRISN